MPFGLWYRLFQGFLTVGLLEFKIRLPDFEET